MQTFNCSRSKYKLLFFQDIDLIILLDMMIHPQNKNKQKKFNLTPQEQR